MGKEGRLP
jgi:hypothetical protein